jgi:2-amino-4-hydroxy-6-hydroxymethyldihydropteridine diphosphokinase
MPTADRPAIAYIGLGGNIGDPAAAMAEALHILDARPDCRVRAVSRLYRTPPWGKTDQDWFFNAAAAVETRLGPHALLALCLEIEQSMKRIRVERWGPRTIDLDILAFDDLDIADETLTLPHPRMRDRAFVLMPLADLAADVMIDGRPVADWLEQADKAGIEIADQDRQWWSGMGERR